MTAMLASSSNTTYLDTEVELSAVSQSRRGVKQATLLRLSRIVEPPKSEPDVASHYP